MSETSIKAPFMVLCEDGVERQFHFHTTSDDHNGYVFVTEADGRSKRVYGIWKWKMSDHSQRQFVGTGKYSHKIDGGKKAEALAWIETHMPSKAPREKFPRRNIRFL